MKRNKLFACLVAGTILSIPVAADIDTGVTALETGDFKAAISAFEPDLSKEATAFEAHWRTGQALVSMGNSKKALKYLERAIEIQPDHADALYWWGAANGEVAGEASVFSAPGYAKACRNAFERVLELDPTHIEARAGLVEYFLAAPGFLGGDKEKALAQAEEIKKLDKARGLSELATVYMAMENTEAALAVLNAAVAEFPADMGARLGRGMIQRQLENHEAALNDFATLRQMSLEGQEVPEEAAVLKGLGHYYFGAVSSSSGLRVDEGVVALEGYLKSGQFDVPLREGFSQYYLAKLYLQQGNIDKAQELAKAARKYDKDKGLKKLLKKLEKQLKEA